MRACCFLFCLGEAAVAVGGPSARSNATEVLGTLSPAPPRTAFLVVGAAYDIRNDVLQRYVENVVKPYGGQTRTFALVKAIHWDGKPYDDATTAKLAAMVQKTLRPTDSVVSNKDPTTVARFGNVSQDAIDCLWPRKGHGKFSEGLTLPPVAGYDKSPTIETCRKRFVYWWGAMQLAHDMMAKHEARNGTTPFESVIFVRVGVDVLSPIPHFAKIRRDAIYTHRDVPVRTPGAPGGFDARCRILFGSCHVPPRPPCSRRLTPRSNASRRPVRPPPRAARKPDTPPQGAVSRCATVASSGASRMLYSKRKRPRRRSSTTQVVVHPVRLVAQARAGPQGPRGDPHRYEHARRG
ncbi:hypothetical protein M885DRAFT_230081 [Pelagophyceae sp. CCMP2097]|nr:hypothetical protein M885DRAFT_230081 [Pelagophyceae sp. CCMP2097]